MEINITYDGKTEMRSAKRTPKGPSMHGTKLDLTMTKLDMRLTLETQSRKVDGRDSWSIADART